MFDASENDLRFAIQHGLDAKMREMVASVHDISDDTIDAVLSEAAKFSRDVLAPLNQSGDQQGCTWHSDNTVTTPDGFADAFKAMGEAGWCSIEASEEFGGKKCPKSFLQQLPKCGIQRIFHSLCAICYPKAKFMRWKRLAVMTKNRRICQNW